MQIRSLWLLAALLFASVAGAHACPVVPTINLAADGYGSGCTTVIPQASSYQGTATIPAATNSFALVSGNVAMAPGSALPTSFLNLIVVNTGPNPTQVCWFSSANTAGAGCETLQANGGNDQINLGGQTTAPSFYSPLGTTIFFRN